MPRSSALGIPCTHGTRPPARMIALAGLHVSAQLGYLALFGLVAAESAGVPVPGETSLIAAAVLASRGRLDLVAVIPIAAVAAITGDNIGYLIGRTGGRRVLEHRGPLLGRRKEILRRGEPFFAKHGAKAVFLGRWFAGLRIAAAWLAGINRMHWLTFAFWNALGGIAWATTVGLAAYLLGPTAERIFKTVGVAGVAVVVLLVAGVVVWRKLRSRRSAHGAPARSGGG
jgi:membrane-associated protein